MDTLININSQPEIRRKLEQNIAILLHLEHQ